MAKYRARLTDYDMCNILLSYFKQVLNCALKTINPIYIVSMQQKN